MEDTAVTTLCGCDDILISTPIRMEIVKYITTILYTLQMADLNLFNAAERVGVDTLMKGVPYRIMFAQKCQTPQGVRLILKLRAHPRNIFVKMPNYSAGVLEMSDRINKLFVNFHIEAGSTPVIPSFNYATQTCPRPHIQKCR